MKRLSPSSGKEMFSVGTLAYSLPMLLYVCMWIVLGGMCYNTLAYVLVPTVLPITLNGLGASNELIGLVVGSVPQLMNAFMNPVVSTASDRFRSKWGRRRPFLLLATPFVTASLILIGWTPEVMEFLSSRNWIAPSGEKAAGILLICIFMVIFQFFSLIVGSVYCYLFPDAVPGRFMGRFMTLMQIGSMLGSYLFNRFLMGLATDAPRVIYTSVGLIYLVVFTGMCLAVKEGEYPPPEPMAKKSGGILSRAAETVKVYLRECFGCKFYLFLFIGTAMTQASTVCRTLFNSLFATVELGLSAGDFGKVMGDGALLSILALLLAGVLIDKLHALRIFIGTGVVVVIFNVLGYFYVTDYRSFYWIGLLIAVIYAVQFLCIIPMFAALFPPDKYGQFSSANAIINCVFLFLSNWLGGICVDKFGYRFIFIWDFIFTLAATAFLLIVYFDFMKRGGDRNFKAPELS